MSIKSSNNFETAISDLKKDLLAEGGAQITTMRNYRFAILHYEPSQEFKLRSQIRTLTNDLKVEGWNCLSISLHSLLMERIKEQEPRFINGVIHQERRLAEKNPQRALQHLKDKISPFIEEKNGISEQIIKRVEQFAEEYADSLDKTVVFIGRAGSLYPFFRSSALLKHLDGKTQNLPVVLLYPGTRHDLTALSFMGEVQPDRDYRPRIY